MSAEYQGMKQAFLNKLLNATEAVIFQAKGPPFCCDKFGTVVDHGDHVTVECEDHGPKMWLSNKSAVKLGIKE